jgi:hypothetical protein
MNEAPETRARSNILMAHQHLVAELKKAGASLDMAQFVVRADDFNLIAKALREEQGEDYLYDENDDLSIGGIVYKIVW